MSQESKQEEMGKILSMEDFLKRRIVSGNANTKNLNDQAIKIADGRDVEKSVFAAPLLNRAKASVEKVTKDYKQLQFILAKKMEAIEPEAIYRVSQKFVQPTSPWWNGFQPTY